MTETQELRSTEWPLSLRIVLAVGIFALLAVVLPGAIDLMKDEDTNRLTVVALAITLGVGGVFFLFWAMDQLVDLLPTACASACGRMCSSDRRWSCWGCSSSTPS